MRGLLSVQTPWSQRGRLYASPRFEPLLTTLLFDFRWLYSGMAFRMVSDLGLHHSTAHVANLGSLGAEDLEIRRRLFWSCYFWDKAISLYLGRMPVLTEVPSNGTLELGTCCES